MQTIGQDISFGLRVLRKSPGFTMVAIVTLALGIGANTAIFTLLDGLALRDLNVPHPEQLVRFGAQPEDDTYVALSVPLFEQIEADQRVFSSCFAWSSDYLSTVEINGNLSRHDLWAVTGSFYSELGGTPELGRLSLAAMSSGVPSTTYHTVQRICSPMKAARLTRSNRMIRSGIVGFLCTVGQTGEVLQPIVQESCDEWNCNFSRGRRDEVGAGTVH
jgi:hypothetical protein